MLTRGIEAYRMNRRMTEDPMANYVDTEAWGCCRCCCLWILLCLYATARVFM